MSSHTLVAFGIAALTGFITLGAGLKARHAWQERSALKRAASASANTLRAGQGPVELQGTARAGEHTFTSPLTQQECVAYRFQKQELQTKRVNDPDPDDHGTETRQEWVTIHDEEAGAPFTLDDGTGEVVVDGATADLDMERSYEVDTGDVTDGIGDKVVAKVKGLMGQESEQQDEHEIPDEYVQEIKNAHDKRRYREALVHDGEEVYVYGEALRPEQTPHGSQTPQPPEPGLLDKIAGMFGIGGDEPGSQDQRRQRRLPSAEDGTLAETPLLNNARTVISWGVTAPTFVVSDQGKSSVVSDYRNRVLVSGGITLVAAGVTAAAVLWGLNIAFV